MEGAAEAEALRSGRVKGIGDEIRVLDGRKQRCKFGDQIAAIDDDIVDSNYTINPMEEIEYVKSIISAS